MIKANVKVIGLASISKRKTEQSVHFYPEHVFFVGEMNSTSQVDTVS